MHAEQILTTVANELIDFARENGSDIKSLVRSFLRKRGPKLSELIRPSSPEAPPAGSEVDVDTEIDDLIDHGDL